MKMTWSKWLVGAGAVSIALGWPWVAWAGTGRYAGDQITVRGVVPERRVVVVDSQEKILSFSSNTNNDIAPRVVLMTDNGPQIPLSSVVARRYQALLQRLRANRRVIVRPVATPLTDLFPEFIRSDTTPVMYEVEPARADGDSGQPYIIAEP